MTAMAKEVEQKFLVTGDGWRAAAGSGRDIQQFYLAESEERSVRVRISNGREARLTLKFGAAGRTRDEFEYVVPLADAEEMRAFAIGNIVSKTRYVVSLAGRDWEVDVFSGPLEGLVLAEIEAPDEVLQAVRPPWIGREVTADGAYYNLSLAINGLPETVA
jgi:adenylate cyclase